MKLLYITERSSMVICKWFVMATFCGLSCQPLWSQQRPNVIVINTDDWGYGDLSCLNGLTDIRTPHIDLLAKNGIRFTNGYATAPQCSPSRAGLITGRYQQRFGFNEIPDCPLPLSETTIASRLQEAGYMTGIVGKWHLDPNPLSANWYKEFYPSVSPDKEGRFPASPLHLRIPYLPYARGFAKFFFGELNQYYANFFIDGQKTPSAGTFFKQEGFRIDIQTHAALKFIHDSRKAPFFLYLGYFGPHTPLRAPEKYLKLFPGNMPERRRHALATMFAIDKGVGEIMASLKRLGIDENTLIFFLSDNGAPLGITKEDTSLKEVAGWDGSLNEPLRGEKGMLTEGGIRVPFIVSWLNQYPKEKVMDIPVSTLDVMPTILSAARIALTGDEDGLDLSPYISQKTVAYPDRYLFWRFWNQSAVRYGKWKYLLVSDKHEFLFEIDRDSSETKNLVSRYPRIAKQLKAHLEEWSEALIPAGLSHGKMNIQERNWYRHYLQVED